MTSACMLTSHAIPMLVHSFQKNALLVKLNISSQCCYDTSVPNVVFVLQTFSQTNITKVCPGSQCMFAFYGGESFYHRYILVLHLCNLFVFLWLVNFTIALGQCTLAGAFASYYWALKKPNDIPACPLCSSFCRAIRYDRTVTLGGTIAPPTIFQLICRACSQEHTLVPMSIVSSFTVTTLVHLLLVP